jgi:saccharopine dehydrogenase-like NADP-dependent oxidoreductase
MTEIAIVGAGEMGRATLGVLARHLPDARFRVLDRKPDNLNRARELAPGVVGELIDLDREQPDLGGARLVANFAGPFYHGSTAIARAAMRAGVPYVDICDDVEGIRPILALDAEARTGGVALITGAGNSPGSSNLMAKRLLELYPEIDGIRIVWVVGDTDPGGLAPLRHMLHMAVAPCPVWRDGAFVDEPGFVPSTARVHDLPEIGQIAAYNTAHSEPITLARAFPELRHISVQGALLPAWANEVFSALGRIGFGYGDLEVEVDGRAVDPPEVLWKMLWARHHARRRDGDRRGLTVVQVQGLSGDALHATMTIVDPWPMVRTTALGAAAAVLAILDQVPPAGAWGTEILQAQAALDILADLAKADGAIPGGLRLQAPAAAHAGR